MSRESKAEPNNTPHPSHTTSAGAQRVSQTTPQPRNVIGQTTRTSTHHGTHTDDTPVWFGDSENGPSVRIPSPSGRTKTKGFPKPTPVTRVVSDTLCSPLFRSPNMLPEDGGRATSCPPQDDSARRQTPSASRAESRSRACRPLRHTPEKPCVCVAVDGVP